MAWIKRTSLRAWLQRARIQLYAALQHLFRSVRIGARTRFRTLWSGMRLDRTSLACGLLPVELLRHINIALN
jgi:hypothetical protein